MAFSWQLIRQIFHRLWIGRLLSRQTGGLLADGYLHISETCLFKIIAKYFSITRYEAATSYQELALVYHNLHQIQLIDTNEEKNHLGGFVTALTAVNLAEAVGARLPAENLIDIYIHAALRIKASSPYFAHSLQK